MKQLKKTLLTLVALLAVTTGAWADETPLLTINASSEFTMGSKTFDNKVTVTFSNFVYYDGEEGWYADGDPSLLTVAGTNGYTITSCKFYTANGEAETGYTIEGKSPSVYLSASTEVYTDANQSVYLGYQGITKIEVYGTAPSASSGPEVAWDKAKKTGTFTMPGGNVTLEPEYYPQATVADGGVTAADADARATTDDPLVKVDATKLTGAKKLMYFVSNSGTAPAYDAEGWTVQLPTAEGFTQQGTVYVWYYPVGTDEGVDGATATYSDGDMNATALEVNIAAAPTYAVTFAEGVNPEPPAEPEWTASPAAGVTKGQTVTVTYTGTKKVIGVKAEKKAKAPDPITVTWNNDDITGSGNSFTKDGVTITAGSIDFFGKDFMGDGTFTTTLGNFTKIEVTAYQVSVSGTGWSGSTWTGNASSVSFVGDIFGMDAGNTKFVFTIEPTN